MAVTEGWLTQPDGSKKYRTKDGKLHDTNPSNWTSYPGQPSIDAALGTNLTKAGKFFRGLAGNSDVQNTAITIGSMLSPVPIAGAVTGLVRQNPRATSIATGQGDPSAAKAEPAPAAPAAPAAPSPTGRDSKRTGPGGVEQTGTQTGIKPMTIDDVNSALGRIGSNNITNPYSSNNLPATEDYEVPNTGGKTPPQYSADEILAAGYRMGGGDDTGAQQLAAGFNMGKGLAGQTDGAPVDSNVMKGIAAGKEVDTGATPDQTSGLGAALSDKAGMRFTAPEEQGEGAKYAPPTVIDSAEIQRRRSFLDADNSMQGLRNIEADQGIYVAGGKYHHVNPNAGKEGQNDFIEISKKQRDGIMRGGEGAEQLRKSFVDRINGNSGQAVEADKQFADAPQILENPVRQGGDKTSYFQTPAGSTVEPSTDFTDPPKVDMNGEEDYRNLVGKVKGNPYLR